MYFAFLSVLEYFKIMLEEMKPNYLLANEVTYELRIRGVNTNRDINEKRKILGRALIKEKGRDIVLEDPAFDFDTERAALDETLESIRSLVSDFVGPPTDSMYLRLRSRLVHATNRAKRLKPGGDPEKVNYMDEAYATCLHLEAELEDHIVVDRDAILVQPAPVNPPTVITVPSPNKTVPIYKWDVKFDGTSKSFGVEAFIERVEELSSARGVSQEELFAGAVDLFTGKALEWWRYVKPTVNNWESLMKKLKKDFLPEDNDENLWKLIKNRKQLHSEPITLFISEMETYFRRLSTAPAERTKIKRIKKNLMPKFYEKVALTEFQSVSELAEVCRKWEEVLAPRSKSDELAYLGEAAQKHKGSQKLRNYRKPNKGADCRCGKPIQHVTSGNISPLTQNTSAEQGNNKPVRRNNLTPIVCWNCNGLNHTFTVCRQKRKKFCFKCGNPDVTMATCKRCPGNDQAR